MRPHVFLSATVLFPLSLLAEKPEECCSLLPYDADLYRRDVEVVAASGEFLYWTVEEGALDYAHKMTHPTSTPTYANGKVKSASFEMSPGVRCSLNYFNAPKYWEVRAQYTHFDTEGKDRSERPSATGEFLTGTWPQGNLASLVHAHSSIHFNYNLFEAWVDRFFNPNPHLRIRMISTIEAVWMNQDWNVRYFDENHASASIRNRWHYTGAGMRMGIWGDWFWGKDIYVTGLGTLGLFMGRYHNKAQETVTSQSQPIMDTNFTDTRPAYVAQFSLGPSWQKNFCHNRVEIFAGYELTAWFNLQEVRRSTVGTPAGGHQVWINTSAIALHGLTTRLTIDF